MEDARAALQPPPGPTSFYFFRMHLSALGLPLAYVWGRVVAWTAYAGARAALDPNFGGLGSGPASGRHPLTRTVDGSALSCVGDCTCIVPTLGDLRETSGPRIVADSTDAAVMAGSSISPIKKNFVGPRRPWPLDQ